MACQTTASIQEPSGSAQHAPRKKNRKRQKRKGKKKLEKKKEKQRYRHRMPSGVPEQESGSSLVQILVRNLVIFHMSLAFTCEKAIETAKLLKVGWYIAQPCILKRTEHACSVLLVNHPQGQTATFLAA